MLNLGLIDGGVTRRRQRNLGERNRSRRYYGMDGKSGRERKISHRGRIVQSRLKVRARKRRVTGLSGGQLGLITGYC